MHRLEIPPGGAARAHVHEHHETAIYVLEGRAEMRFGDGLRELTAQELQIAQLAAVSRPVEN
jgi:uncharacterized RmlC-like cupin family protein